MYLEWFLIFHSFVKFYTSFCHVSPESIFNIYDYRFWIMSYIPYFFGSSTQPSSTIMILFNHDSFRAWSNFFKFVNFMPPKLGRVCKISFRNLGGFLLQIKFLNKFSSFSNISELGDGRDNRTCMIFDINKLLNIVIFLYGVKTLAFHIATNFRISVIFKFIF